MTIDLKSYERELAKIAALNGKTKSLTERAKDTRIEATVLTWQLLRRTLVDWPLLTGSGTRCGYTPEQAEDFAALLALFGYGRCTFQSYRTAANKIQTSAELLNFMHTNTTFGWSSIARLICNSPTQGARQRNRNLGIPTAFFEDADKDGHTPRQVNKALAEYLKLSAIQTDFAIFRKEMFG